MFLLTESGTSINTDYIKSISWVELSDKTFPYLVSAWGKKQEVYYLSRFGTLLEAQEYVDSITRAIEASNKARS